MKKVLFASALALALSACASGALTVETPNASDYRTDTATIVHDNSRVEVDENNLTYTEEKLAKELYEGEDAPFSKGDGLTIKYRYVGFDEGSRAARYLLGPFAGGSKIHLEVDFVSPAGEVLATVRGEGSVSGGFMGGSNKSGIDKAIKEVAEYAAKEFAK